MVLDRFGILHCMAYGRPDGLVRRGYDSPRLCRFVSRMSAAVGPWQSYNPEYDPLQDAGSRPSRCRSPVVHFSLRPAAVPPLAARLLPPAICRSTVRTVVLDGGPGHTDNRHKTQGACSRRLKAVRRGDGGHARRSRRLRLAETGCQKAGGPKSLWWARGAQGGAGA